MDEGFLFCRDLAVAKQRDGGLGVVVSDEFGGAIAFGHNLPIVGGDLACFAGAVLLGFEQGLETYFIHLQRLFACDECREVHRKAKGVVQLKHHVPGQHVPGLHP